MLATTNVAAGFSVWHLSLNLITIFIDTQICFFKSQLQSYSFYHLRRLLGTSLFFFFFNDASTKIIEFQTNNLPFQPIQKDTLQPNRINLHIVGWFEREIKCVPSPYLVGTCLYSLQSSIARFCYPHLLNVILLLQSPCAYYERAVYVLYICIKEFDPQCYWFVAANIVFCFVFHPVLPI